LTVSLSSCLITISWSTTVQKSIRVRESKFGRALVLETYAKAGGYILGFRVDPQDRIAEVYQEIHSLFQIYSVTPIFGVDFTVEAETPDLAQLLQPKVNEDTELIDDHEDAHAIAVGVSIYIACSTLGLQALCVLLSHVGLLCVQRGGGRRVPLRRDSVRPQVGVGRGGAGGRHHS
jgi:hypothetical protein